MKLCKAALPVTAVALTVLVLFGCSGTETGNPDVAYNQEVGPCAVAAFDAMQTGNKWQWQTYAAAGQGQVFCVAGANGLGKQIITRKDTLINGVLYLVIPMEDTILTFDTTFIRKQLVRADTVTDTFTNKTSSDSLVVVYQKIQTDTFKVTDTIVHVDTLLRRDTLYIRDTIHVADATPKPGSGPAQNWGAKISFQQLTSIDTAAVKITVVPSNQVYMQLRPVDSLGNTMSEAVDPRNVQVTGHATPAGVNTLVLRTAIDNGLRRVAYGPDPASKGPDTALLAVTDYRYTGTAESSFVAYRIARNPADASGAADRLVSLDKSVVYRSGALARVDMRILFEQPLAKGQNPARGYIGIVATLADGSTGVIGRGEIDVEGGWLLGSYERSGKQYDVFVDSTGQELEFDVNIYGPSGPRIK